MLHINMLTEKRPIKRIVLTGTESVGKSYLANAMATHFHTNFVEEYGRTYVEKFGTDFDLIDISHIAAGHLFYEDQAAQVSNQVLFCDTDLIVTKVWSELVLGECPEWIDQMISIRHYDLWLLLDVDWPWHGDGTRKFPNLRQKMFHRIHEILIEQNRPFKVISGNGEQRIQAAIEAVEDVI
jgi:NadR type nicotinamide-nucleotide adenylyltransferase